MKVRRRGREGRPREGGKEREKGEGRNYEKEEKNDTRKVGKDYSK